LLRRNIRKLEMIKNEKMKKKTGERKIRRRNFL